MAEIDIQSGNWPVQKADVQRNQLTGDRQAGVRVEDRVRRHGKGAEPACWGRLLPPIFSGHPYAP